jgi:hypothetical protein
VVAPASPSPSIGALRPTVGPAASPLPSPTPPALLPFALARSFPGVDELNGSPPDPSLGKHRVTLNTRWFPAFPRPDRSDQHRTFTKTADNDILDIGWCEGRLKDGRPYFAELWAQDQITCVVVFFSRRNLEGLTDETAANILEQEGLVQFKKRYCSVSPWSDAAGNQMWSVNLVVGDDNETYLKDTFKFLAYLPPIH